MDNCLGILDDKLSLYQHNSTLYTSMDEQKLSYELHTWKVLELQIDMHVLLHK